MSLVGRGQPFLHGLGRQAREELLGLGAERRFAAQEHLLRENDEGSHVLVILNGWAVVSTATERASSRLILALRGPGELVGEMAMLDGSPRSATITALGPLSARVIMSERFRRFVAGTPQANGLLMAQLAARLRSADEERRSLASLTVLQRLAERLLELPAVGPSNGRYGTGNSEAQVVLVDLAQHDLADAVGATREAVAKALRLLRDADVVRTGQRRIELVDPGVLRLLASGGSFDFRSRTS
ncbi:Crp/Fnr family transcriptional regulator [Streptomyces albipurpureus]|uniref:Crp/Fnr family transcriptional regulator n=1 Tax=Streptomyces albipurpureus TaxID=2897419 RepID=A0ABT0UL53_9ACTN|nr:Crp/Fnr family transcriptional regulator [Streptomyces sp. CWNU-1]MCM2388835.1 Crp/Fnr family transcriptional regulator [Streptomyces sp. CWNU-1]